MNLHAYFKPLLRWWWLVVAATFVAAISSFLATRGQLPTYQAKTTLMIGRTIEDPNPTSGEFILAQQLASTYADIANREPLRVATRDALGLDGLPEYLAQAVPNTQLIEIRVTDFNPQRAQVVANELAHQLILRSPTSARPEDQERQDFISGQLDDLESQIVATQDEIARLQDELGGLNSAREIQDTQNQITALQQKLATLQGTYASLLSNTQQGATNSLTVVEPADLPTTPIGPNKSLSILLSAGIGFALAAGAAYLLEYLDDTLKDADEISHFLGTPVIGFIGETRESEEAENGAYVSKHPRSQVAEAYRSLRANLEFASVDKPLKTILIASFDINAGKSSVALNLSVVMAQGEKRVILMDADLRKSSIHTYTNLSNRLGLSDLFRNGADVFEALKPWNEPRIGVITSGDSPPNPAELLGSKKMDFILSRLGEKADLVVIDSPPFVVADALMLAAKVDGVLVVIRPGRTRKKIAIAMMEQLNRAGARILGVVLNRIPHRGAQYYGGFLYYSPYYTNGHYAGEEGVHPRKGVSLQRPKIAVNNYLRLIKLESIKPFVIKIQEKIRPAGKNRAEPPEYTTVYPDESEQDVFNIRDQKD
ncbi:MAG TPA: polysaccharide biosynthesis tyrosine autokinase [Anaerolineales bacterium]|jgi:capsular exopolysaccharide synthesis family protein|nr:polysaccharide biosynthesis tyrosine autokinase [Anaerolineales bacterium]